MGDLEYLTRVLTTKVGDLHVKFKAGKITWEEMDTQATVLENDYLEKIKALLTAPSVPTEPQVPEAPQKP